MKKLAVFLCYYTNQERRAPPGLGVGAAFCDAGYQTLGLFK